MRITIKSGLLKRMLFVWFEDHKEQYLEQKLGKAHMLLDASKYVKSQYPKMAEIDDVIDFASSNMIEENLDEERQETKAD